MSSMETAIAWLKDHEGFRSKVYIDTVGKRTIGYGRNLDDKGVSEHEADLLLRNDVIDVVTELSDFSFWSELTDNRQAVLIDMAVNLGMGGLVNFKNLIRALGNHDYETAAKEMLDSKWAQQLPSRSEFLATAMRNG